MAQIICSVCGGEMFIDQPGGEAYTTEADGAIHHSYDCPPHEPTEE